MNLDGIPIRPTHTIHQFHDFIDAKELEFWHSHFNHEDFWVNITGPDHIEGQPHHQTYNDEYFKANGLEIPYRNLNQRMHKCVEHAFGDDFLLRPHPSFRKWSKGSHMGGHGDPFTVNNKLAMTPNNGSLPRGFYEVATVLYYDDDFDGGELKFPYLDYTVKPAAGMLVVFPCSYGYEHSVTEITRGERTTSATHWIRCATVSRTLSHHTVPDRWWEMYENTAPVFEMLNQPHP